MTKFHNRLKCLLVVLLVFGLLLSANVSAQPGDEAVIYVHTDALGNPVAKTDSTGKVIWRQSYAPYGQTYQQADPDGPGFTGHRHDAATGLVYMQARYYDPKIGRFMSGDPMTFSPDSPGHFNLYWYANGNPYRYTDPDGRDPMMILTPEGPILLPGPPIMGQDGLNSQSATSNVLVHLQDDFNQNTRALGSAIGIAVWNATHKKSSSEATKNREKNIKQGIPEGKLGPSGKSKIITVDHGGKRKEAKDAARQSVGKGGSTVNHTSPKAGKDHYHGTTQSGKKDPVHHEYDH